MHLFVSWQNQSAYNRKYSLFFLFGREATFLTYLVLQRMTRNCLNKNFRKKMFKANIKTVFLQFYFILYGNMD